MSLKVLNRLSKSWFAIFGAALLTAACGDANGSGQAGGDDGNPPDYRYRLTVEVDTPEGLKTGSSVIEVSTQVASATTIPTPGAVTRRARGEAVALDLPDGRTLFALLRSENETDWAANIMNLMGPLAGEGDTVTSLAQEIIDNKQEIELSFWKRVGGQLDRDGYPMLVTFGDLDDPTSVEKVDPKDLAATFGEGVSLKRITVQVTDDPVTSGIEERLGWLPDVRGALVFLPIAEYPPRGTPLPLHNTLTDGNFKKGKI